MISKSYLANSLHRRITPQSLMYMVEYTYDETKRKKRYHPSVPRMGIGYLLNPTPITSHHYHLSARVGKHFYASELLGKAKQTNETGTVEENGYHDHNQKRPPAPTHIIDTGSDMKKERMDIKIWRQTKPPARYHIKRNTPDLPPTQTYRNNISIEPRLLPFAP